MARLSFWVSADQHVGFKAAYDRQLAPLLANHELIESSAPDQLQTEGSSHWFEDPSPSALSHKRQRLLQDPHYREILPGLGPGFRHGQAGCPNALQLRIPRVAGSTCRPSPRPLSPLEPHPSKSGTSPHNLRRLDAPSLAVPLVGRRTA